MSLLADGIVSDVYYDSQTGNTIRFDLGNGYMLTYGQLDDISLKAGDRVAAGDVVGKVAKPTIYYTEEGTNVYYKLTNLFSCSPQTQEAQCAGTPQGFSRP